MFLRKKPPPESTGHSLEAHLQREMQRESAVLLAVVRSFRELDGVARRLGFFSREESYTRYVPWWPIVALLGTYSSGKSTFLNDYLDYQLQLTGNQAVDDKFTVVCFGTETAARTLPALALDADPRFPFYKLSREINEVDAGEGRRLDAYLQLKTCPSEVLRGQIFIDSPGFDADEQRTAVLRITDHIINLSDLVLVFFDARHPESGSMQDTLRHLVEQTVHRVDANKFLYVLNLLDTTAHEDNAEDVVAAWQRALAQKGLIAGRFYRIFSRSAAIPIEDPQARARYEAKRDADWADMTTRIQQVRTGQAYRIVGALARTATDLQEKIVPQLRSLLHGWRTRVLWMDAVLAVGLVVLIGVLVWVGVWDALVSLLSTPDLGLWGWGIGLAIVLVGLGYWHFSVRKRMASRIVTKLRREMRHAEYLENFVRAFEYNTRWYRSLFRKEPVGWNQRTHGVIQQVVREADTFVQQLNDLYTNPSGHEERERTDV
jgi:hypothetical protein